MPQLIVLRKEMKPHSYNTLWYSIGVASSLSVLGCIEEIQNPSAGRLGGGGVELIYVLATGFMVFFGIAYFVHHCFGCAVEGYKKEKIEKRMHFYPLVIGFTFAPLAKVTTETGNRALIYLMLMLLLFHPLVSNLLLARKPTKSQNKTIEEQPIQPPRD